MISGQSTSSFKPAHGLEVAFLWTYILCQKQLRAHTQKKMWYHYSSMWTL